MMPLEQFDDGLRTMGNGIRRAHVAFQEADEGFLQALEGVRVITEYRESIDARLTEMQETLARLEVLVLEHGRQIAALTGALRHRRTGDIHP